MQNSMLPMNLNNQILTHQNHPLLKDKQLQVYERTLSFCRLQLHEEISFRNVRIYENDYIHQIYTINDPKLPHLVFLHGYGGNSMTAVRIFKELYSHFQVHALDAFGIGYSSRGNFKDDFKFDQTRNYFIDAIEEWRNNSKIDQFYLVGHSFGGYLAASYAQKYPHRIIHLSLVSPAGTSPPRQPNEQQMTCRRKFFLGVAKKVYGCNIRPSAAMRNFFFGNKILNSILENRLKLQQEEKEAWKLFMLNLSQQKTSSETGFYHLFEWPLVPKVTIEEIINKSNFNFKIDFYYGDEDWMEKEGAARLVKKHPNVNYFTINNSGHQIVFDNPKQLCLRIITNCLILGNKNSTTNRHNSKMQQIEEMQ